MTSFSSKDKINFCNLHFLKSSYNVIITTTKYRAGKFLYKNMQLFCYVIDYLPIMISFSVSDFLLLSFTASC